MLETHFRAGVFFILHTSSQLINAMNHTGSITCRKSRFSDVYRACALYSSPGKPIGPCSYSAFLAAGLRPVRHVQRQAL
jgi:hypothetical protein